MATLLNLVPAMSSTNTARLAPQLARRLWSPSQFTQGCKRRSLHYGASRRAACKPGPGRPRPKPQGSQARPSKPSKPNPASLSLVAGGSVLSLLFAISSRSVDPPAEIEPHDDRDPSFPRYRLADIRRHDATSAEPWVTAGDKVYNITDWVAAHPGGDVILRAAGGSIDPYWDIFTIHKAPHVREILDQYLIGFIDSCDLVQGKPPADSIEDPFRDDPDRDGRLITHTARPRNAEPPKDDLNRDFLTPNELFYVRNHMWVPVVEEAQAEDHKLTIELPDGETKTYTLSDLRSRFKSHKFVAVLQCSGNRRSDMSRRAGKTNGLPWAVGAISNAEWEGVLLSEVLADAGLDCAARTNGDMHVQFSGLEAYGASIPLSTAVDPRSDVLLAFGMNGKPLPRDHGFPLRAVVPGHVAARSVKWLSKIVVADEESTTQWQRKDYKCFGPNEGAKPDWDKYPSIQEMPITSAITGVWLGECVRKNKEAWMREQKPCARAAPAARDPTAWQAANLPSAEKGEPVAVAGYAYSGGGKEIVRVDVSVDGGKTWDQAELLRDCVGTECSKGSKAWAWRRWRYTGTLPELSTNDGENTRGIEVLVKATDDNYNTQPEHHSDIFNVRGNLATAWHRVTVLPTRQADGEGNKVWSTGKVDGCGFENVAK
ncbi:hypothetical protein GQ53DRAFT_747460 [Thozetella sp. PMI_491]|nr:hypothetical protein GQ53DRAFT_747460 [Thozetella sp. PMI_491]